MAKSDPRERYAIKDAEHRNKRVRIVMNSSSNQQTAPIRLAS